MLTALVETKSKSSRGCHSKRDLVGPTSVGSPTFSRGDRPQSALYDHSRERISYWRAQPLLFSLFTKCVIRRIEWPDMIQNHVALDKHYRKSTVTLLNESAPLNKTIKPCTSPTFHQLIANQWAITATLWSGSTLFTIILAVFSGIGYILYLKNYKSMTIYGTPRHTDPSIRYRYIGWPTCPLALFATSLL